MKILLINPPSTHAAVPSHEWMTTAEDVGAFPPIGLMYLAATLRQTARHEIRMVDMVLERMDIPEIGKIVAEYSPDIVGMTALTPIFYDVMEVAREVKRIREKCHVCLGGAHASAFPDETIVKPEIDSLLLGESEHQFVALVLAIERGDDLKKVPGIVILDKQGSIFKAAEPGYIENINLLPFPAFDLLPFMRYHSGIGTGNAVGTICSSRGCPYDCTFCCRPYRNHRIRTPENIVAEMMLYYEKGIREFFFFDDMFNITPQRVIKVSQAILDSGMKIIWSFRGRVDQVNEEMLQIAKRSGCVQILYGVETATNEGLRNIKKKITIEQALQSVRLTKKVGMETSTNWIIGFPHDKTASDIERLISFARKVNSDYAIFNILSPYSGTELFDDGAKKGFLDGDFWKNYTVHPVPDALIPLWSEHLSREELSRFLRRCYLTFYFRWSKVFSNLIKLRTFSHLKNKIKGLRVLLAQGGYKRRIYSNVRK